MSKVPSYLSSRAVRLTKPERTLWELAAPSAGSEHHPDPGGRMHSVHQKVWSTLSKVGRHLNR